MLYSLIDISTIMLSFTFCLFFIILNSIAIENEKTNLIIQLQLRMRKPILQEEKCKENERMYTKKIVIQNFLMKPHFYERKKIYNKKSYFHIFSFSKD